MGIISQISCDYQLLYNAQQQHGCPFASSLAYGRQMANAESQKSAQLNDQNILIYNGLAASNIWSSGSLENETVVLYKQSMSLLYAQQMHLETCPAISDAEPIVALQTLVDQVQLSERSQAMPICNNSYP